jgi:hypothetical protein
MGDRGAPSKATLVGRVHTFAGARPMTGPRGPSRGVPSPGMPIVEGLSFSYVVHELPRGRFPFRRWRFELWHGARLEAAGWRSTERDALRALRKHASRVAHAMFGLRPPAGDIPPGAGFRPGATVRVQDGGIAFALVPRQLEGPPSALGVVRG